MHERNQRREQKSEIRESEGNVADAEKQFARGLPIGTSSEYPRLGVSGENVADASVENVERQRVSIGIQKERSAASCSSWWATEPDVGGETDGLAGKLDGPQPHVG